MSLSRTLVRRLEAGLISQDDIDKPNKAVTLRFSDSEWKKLGKERKKALDVQVASLDQTEVQKKIDNLNKLS